MVLAILVLFNMSAASAEKKKLMAKTVGRRQRVENSRGSYFFDPNYIIVRVNVPVG